MRRITTAFARAQIHLSGLMRRVVVVSLVVLAVSSQGCSADPAPDCHVRVQEQALPECVEVSPLIDEFDEACDYHVEIVNGCDDAMELTFFCEREEIAGQSWRCPSDRVLAEQSDELVSLMQLSENGLVK